MFNYKKDKNILTKKKWEWYKIALAKTTDRIDVDQLDNQINIEITCPICKTKKKLRIDKSIINQSKQLTTFSIPKHKICSHHFQAFVDKNYKVRGYQKVDFIFEDEAGTINEVENKTKVSEDTKFFQDLKLCGNFVEYSPDKTQINYNKNFLNSHSSIPANLHFDEKNKSDSFMKKNENRKKEMSLKDIYEEFWEFIDENNPEFKDLIINDPRRGN